MNPENLRTRVANVEHGSLSAAARRLKIDQPGVTKQIQRMEAELGITLLTRGPRKTTELTAASGIVVDFARTTLHRYAALRQELAERAEVRERLLTVAARTARCISARAPPD